MAAAETNQNLDTFFKAVSTGSVPELQELLKKMEPDVKVRIANSFNTEGETALIVAIKGNHQEMVKFLVEEMKADIFKMGRFKWKELDYEEAMPLFVAVLSDYTFNQSIVNFLVTKDTSDEDTADPPDILKPFLISKFSKVMQNIDMLELMGAAYILHTHEDGIIRVWLGIYCWTHALRLREMHSALSPNSSAMNRPNISPSASAQKVFGTTTEFRTSAELEEIVARDFVQHEIHPLQAQAFLVIRRIISQLNPDPHPFYFHSLVQFSMNWYRNGNQYSSSVNVVNFILELLHARQWKDVIDYDWCENIVLGALYSITYSRWMKMETPPTTSQLPFDSFMDVINHVTDLVFQLQKQPDPLQKKKANKFVLFLTNTIQMFTEHDKETSPEFKKWLADYIKFTNSHPGLLTILHCTCTRSPLPIKIVQLFTNGKTDPNAQDVDGDTPLHLLAMSKNFPGVEEAVKLLLSVGVHLDLSNKKGVTPLDLFKANKMYLDQKGLFDPYIDELTRTVLPLQCLAAQVIRQNSVPLEDQKIPHSIVSFIENHSAKCGTEGLSQLYFN